MVEIRTQTQIDEFNEGREEEHTRPFWLDPKRMLTTTNAQDIGFLYLGLTFLNAAIAGFYALLMRTELWTPGKGPVFFQTRNYNSAFTMHGSAMFFLVVVPMAAGFGNYLVPRMVASDNDDMYWPKWNNAAFYILLMGSILMWWSQAPIAWTAYTPLTVKLPEPGIGAWVLGLILVGMSSTIGSFNFIMTIWKGRSPEVGWMDMDLFVWSILLYSLLLFLATPVLTVALIFVLFDRYFGTNFYDPNVSTPIMYQHLFWFFSHPEVYILVLPAMGIVSHLIKRFSRKEIFGYLSMVASMSMITIFAFSVWAHHMYVTGLNPFVRIYFTVMTFLIAIPSGIKVFNWITTLYKGEIEYQVPMLFSLSFVIMFMFGGIMGVYLNIVPIDIVFHGTYWVLSHFHFIVAAGSLVGMWGMLYYYFPDMTGKMYHDGFAKLHFVFWTIGNLLTFWAFADLGFMGMPRRYAQYPAKFMPAQRVATVGAFFMGTGFLFFLLSVFIGYFTGETVEDRSNLFNIGDYTFPRPFAEYYEEENGEPLHVEHNNSWTAPLGAFTISLPIWAVAAAVGTGPFVKPTQFGPLPKKNPTVAMILMVVFAIAVVGIFAHEILAKKNGTQLDEIRQGRHWEVWAFLATEVLFFGGLIGSALAIRFNSPTWPEPGQVLDIPLITFNTFVLITSSFTMAKAVESIQNGDKKKMQQYLVATLIFGATFLSLQAVEYNSLISSGELALSKTGTNLYASTFFLQTGFHGAHVFVGLLFLGFILLNSLNGAYSEENHHYVELVGLYWHFVDVVWVVLFSVLYLI